jgi:hypothetical protein
MNEDPTESIRRARIVELNQGLDSDAAVRRAELEAQYGQVWDTNEVRRDFEIKGFMAPLVVATRRSDGQLGSLEFSASPRFYFNWIAD